MAVILNISSCVSKSSDLFRKAEVGDTVAVQKLVDSGMDLDQIPRGSGWNALHVASRNGHIGVVRVLLDGGADANYEGYGGVTALEIASTAGHLEAMELLIANGADVNHQSTYDGYSALLSSAAEGNFYAVKLLVESGANTHAKSLKGESAIDLARKNQKWEYLRVIEFLASLDAR